MKPQRVIALLGRRDEPTDAVEEYCQHLGMALVAHDIQLEIRRVPWNQHGWPASLEALSLQAGTWRGTRSIHCAVMVGAWFPRRLGEFYAYFAELVPASPWFPRCRTIAELDSSIALDLK
jgi:hypothetical protein